MVHKFTSAEEKKNKFFKGWAEQMNKSQKFPYLMDKKGNLVKRDKWNETKRCHDCGATKGTYHMIGCDWEFHPKTREQLLGNTGFRHGGKYDFAKSGIRQFYDKKMKLKQPLDLGHGIIIGK